MIGLYYTMEIENHFQCCIVLLEFDRLRQGHILAQGMSSPLDMVVPVLIVVYIIVLGPQNSIKKIA